MYKRLISLPNNQSYFLFGQRGTGKTTLLKSLYGSSALEINLLDSKTFLTLEKAPWKLKDYIFAKKPEQNIVVIDEIQKIPLLLDEVHKIIEEDKICFALTGSSARKLKRHSVNLLAGRAFDYKLYPLSYLELKEDFDLHSTLHWGSLPKAIGNNSASVKEEYLYSYVSNYLREEIILEQIVRNIEPFNRFLEVAAQSNGDLISYSNLAKDVGISDVSIKSYFSILEDTLIGYTLPSYHTSIRKKQKLASKFYFHDLGIIRTLTNQVSLAPSPKSFEYGNLFETFIINEIIKINEYKRTRFRFSHLRIDDKYEADLIIEKPNKETILVEIKSKDNIKDREVNTLGNLLSSFQNAKALCLSQDPERKLLNNVLCLPWEEGINEIFGLI